MLRFGRSLVLHGLIAVAALKSLKLLSTDTDGNVLHGLIAVAALK